VVATVVVALVQAVQVAQEEVLDRSPVIVVVQVSLDKVRMVAVAQALLVEVEEVPESLDQMLAIRLEEMEETDYKAASLALLHTMPAVVAVVLPYLRVD
jgi:hypothetical protein